MSDAARGEEWWRQELIKAHATGNEVGADLLSAVIALNDGQHARIAALDEKLDRLNQPAQLSPEATAAASREVAKGASVHVGAMVRQEARKLALRLVVLVASVTLVVAGGCFLAGWLTRGQVLVWAGSQICQGGACYVPVYPSR